MVCQSSSKPSKAVSTTVPTKAAAFSSDNAPHSVSTTMTPAMPTKVARVVSTTGSPGRGRSSSRRSSTGSAVSINSSSSSNNSARQQGNTLFPWKLFDMLADCESKGLDSIVSWLPHGRAFRVHNSKAFVATIMHKHFKQTKYKSFQRQLNLWGFKRITKSSHPDKGAYWHTSFTKNDRMRCQQMSRQNHAKKEGTSSGADSDAAVPDFASQAPAPDAAVTTTTSIASTTTNTILSSKVPRKPRSSTGAAAAVTKATSKLSSFKATGTTLNGLKSRPRASPSSRSRPSLIPADTKQKQQPKQQQQQSQHKHRLPSYPTQDVSASTTSVPSLMMMSKDLTLSAEPNECLSFHDIVQSLTQVPDLPWTPTSDNTSNTVPMMIDSVTSTLATITSANSIIDPDDLSDDEFKPINDPVSFEGCQFFLMNEEDPMSTAAVQDFPSFPHLTDDDDDDDDTDDDAKDVDDVYSNNNVNINMHVTGQYQHAYHQQHPSFLGTMAA